MTPLAVGRVIVATRQPHDPTVAEVIRELGLELQVILNKSSVMVLPPGVDKRRGLVAALDELGVPPERVVGVGDAENDLAFLELCGRAVAVANALPSVKARADLVTEGARGDGVVQLIDTLVADGRRDLQPHPALGRQADQGGVDAADAKIVIVANRGPNDFVWEQDAWIARPASGGLVSLLTPLARRPNVAWFCCVSEPPDARRARRGLFTTAADQTDPELNVVPVPLPAEIYHAYYGQISNEVLWMLQHHVLGPGGYARLDARRHHAWAAGYVEANRRLAEAVTTTCPTARAFLVQDYHLYPLPALLRGRFPQTPILHFTHIPFPEPSMLRLLPPEWRDTILRGLLGADVVGLQTRDDVHAFVDCCAEFLDTAVDRGASSVRAEDGRRVAVRAYPASVEPGALRRAMASPAVAAARRQLAPAMGKLSIIRVDRLDPSKNQRIGFEAFARLLETRPDLRGRVQFLAFLVPSRTDLAVYRAHRDAVYRTIREINRRFADVCGGEPIQVFYTNDRDQALAAMECCDALLINSLEDGMNLVAKEWAVVSRRPGVMILSETAGVVEAARGSALLISPLDVEGTARAMAEAVDMPPAERAERLARFRKRVTDWTARDWLAAQLGDLGVGMTLPGR